METRGQVGVYGAACVRIDRRGGRKGSNKDSIPVMNEKKTMQWSLVIVGG